MANYSQSYFDQIRLMVNHAYVLIDDENYTYLENSLSNSNKNQGFKLHISPYIENVNEVLLICTNFCVKNNLSFKFIKNKEKLMENYSDLTSLENSCKFITIYLENNDQELANKLSDMLKNYRGLDIFSDKKVPNSEIVYYRYGDFRKNNNSDDHRKFFDLPEGVSDLYVSENSQEFLLNNKYKILNILNKKASSLTYLATFNEEKYIIKHAKYGTFTSHFVESTKRKNDEVLFYNKLINKSNFANHIENFNVENDLFTVWKFMDGTKISDQFDEFSCFYDFNKEKNLHVKNFYLIFEQLLELLSKNNELSFIDIVPRNLIWNRNENKLYFIDLDHCELKKQSWDINNLELRNFIYQYFTNEVHLFENLTEQRLKLFFYKLLKVNKIDYCIYLLFLETFNKDNDLNSYFEILKNKKTDSWPKIKDELISFNANSKLRTDFNLDELYFWLISFYKNKDKLFKLNQFANHSRYNFKKIVKMGGINIRTKDFVFLDFFNAMLKLNWKNDKQKINELLLKYEEKIVKVENKIYYNNNNSYLSPYFIDGTAGYLFCLVLYFKYIQKDENVKSKILELSNSLTDSFANKFSIYNGLAGILLVQFMVYNLFKDKKLLIKLSEQLELMSMFAINNFNDGVDKDVISEFELSIFHNLCKKIKKKGIRNEIFI